MVEKLMQLVMEEEGQGMTEYGLVLGLIAVAAVASLVLLRDKIVELYVQVLEVVGIGVTGTEGTPTPTP